MPISRLDLPHIVQLARDLFRLLEALPEMIREYSVQLATDKADLKARSERGCRIGSPRDRLEQAREALIVALTPGLDEKREALIAVLTSDKLLAERLRAGDVSGLPTANLNEDQKRALARLQRLPAERLHAGNESDITAADLDLDQRAALTELLLMCADTGEWDKATDVRPDRRKKTLETIQRCLGVLATEVDRQAGASRVRGGGDEGEKQSWLTVKEAATASGCTPGEISRAVNKGNLKSNGETRKKRRVDAADLTLWLLRREAKQGAVESDAAVERKLRKAAE